MLQKEKYNEEYRYRFAQKMIEVIKKNGKIHTKVFGKEKLPQEGGYVMYPNHQGKYDALGIIAAHEAPCSFLMDKKKSYSLFVNEIVQLCGAGRLDKDDPKAQVKMISDVTKRVKDGKKYIIFPEGGYDNRIQKFMPGSFKCSLRAKTPIVPVLLIDSYRVFGENSLKPVTTQIHFLEPILYEEYNELNTTEMVKYSVFPLFSILLVVLLCLQSENVSAETQITLTIVSVSLLLLMNIYVFFFLRNEINHKLATSRQSLLINHAFELTEMYNQSCLEREDQAKKNHEYKNIISAIEKLLNDEKYDEAAKYCRSQISNYAQAANIVNTGNPIINAVFLLTSASFLFLAKSSPNCFNTCNLLINFNLSKKSNAS